MILRRPGRLPFWSVYRVVPVIVCSTPHASRQCRSCDFYKHIQSSRAMEHSIPSHRRKPIIISIQPMESRRRRSVPLRYIRPNRPIRSSHPSMRIPSPHPDVIRVLYILATIVRIPTAIKRGAPFRYVASVILVALLVLTISVSISRLSIASIL